MPTYGQRPDDVVTDSRGNAQPGVLLKLYTTQALAEAGGTPLGTATTGYDGTWTYETDELDLYARTPNGRVWQVAQSVEALVSAAEASATAAAESQTLAQDALNAASSAQSAAEAAASDAASAEAAVAGKLDASVAATTYEAGLDRVVYVTTTGNDSASGKTWASAKATIAGALTALGGLAGRVQLGPGTFTTSATHELPTGTQIVGSGRGATTISYTGSGVLFSGVSGTRTYNQLIAEVTLSGPGKATTAVAIDLVDVSQASVHGFIVGTFGTAFKHRSTILGGAVYNHFTNGFVTSCGTGVRFDLDGSNGSRWFGVKFGACTIAVDIVDSNQNNFHACQFEANTTAVKIDGTLAGLADHNSFDHCRFEGNTTAVNIVGTVVRDTEITWPAIFGTWTATDAGTRTKWLVSNPLVAPPGTQRYRITRTGSYSLSVGDDVVFFNASSVTATLPSAVTALSGRVYTIKNLHATSLTVTATAGNVDGAASQALAQYEAGRYISDGTNWYSI